MGLDWLERKFPNLVGTTYAPTSVATLNYNCIAWAAGDDSRWWWPHPQSFWPDGVAREITLRAFEAAYATLGYVKASNELLEVGVEKIAIYVDSNSAPLHAARQLSDGTWTSKLGLQIDISHTLNGLEGGEYGTVGLVLQRSR
jgi:hypothetical protein